MVKWRGTNNVHVLLHFYRLDYIRLDASLFIPYWETTQWIYRFPVWQNYCSLSKSFTCKHISNQSHDRWPWNLWPAWERAALYSDSSGVIFMVFFFLLPATDKHSTLTTLWPRGVMAGPAEGGRGERPCAGQTDPGREARAEDGALPRKGNERESWAAAHFRTTEQRSDSRPIGVFKRFSLAGKTF